nr:hypothetical protein [Rikenellaceae bacterium]
MVVIHRITLKNANKMKKIFFCMLALVAAMLGSCVSDEEVRIMPEFSYSDNEVLLPRAEGSSYTAPIATTEPVVTAEYNCEWLSVEVNTRHAIFTTLSENLGEENRSTEVILRAGDFMEEVTVTQQCLEVADNGLVVGQQTEDGLGMIFWVDPENPTAGKAISLQRLEGKAFELSPKYHEATSLIDGKANTALFEEHTAEEAAGYCKSLGEGWYLPAVRELHELFAAYNGVGYGEDGFTNAVPDAISDREKQARAAFDKLLTDLGGTIINKAAATGNGESYWSSTENEDGTKARYIRFGKWAEDAGNKTGTSRFVRCMFHVGDFKVPEEPTTIKLSTQSIALEAEAGSAGATTVTSNKDLSTIAVVIADPSWVGYAVADGVVTFTASSANETDAIRSTTATITVGAGENTATATVTISQAKKITVEPWKLGEVVPDTDKSKGGIVVWVDPTDGTRAKIVSMKREKIAWGSMEVAFGIGDAEGAVNTAKIAAHEQASTCTILAWVQALGEGWFIPSKDELTAFYDYYNGGHSGTAVNTESISQAEKDQRDAVEAVFAAAGADPVNANGELTGSAATGSGESYWTSNEKSGNSATQVFYVRFGKFANNSQSNKDSSSRYARGMRVVKK